jgi:hypothetical protein
MCVVPQLHPAARTLFIRSKNARLNGALPLCWLKDLIPEREINKQMDNTFFIQPYDDENNL